jgi:RNA polymerase sigma factor (sigma-70 family)
MRTQNISLGGLKLEASLDLSVGESLHFDILTNGPKIRCKGKILAVEEFGNKVHARLLFAPSSDSEHGKLAKYLRTLSRRSFQEKVISDSVSSLWNTTSHAIRKGMGVVASIFRERQKHRELQQLNSWLSLLTDTERTVITLRFGLKGEDVLTLESIGKRLGLTSERVRQIEADTLEKLRDMSKKQEENVEDEVLEEVSAFSAQNPGDYPEVEEEYREGEDTPRWARPSLVLIGLICVVVGVLLFAIISFMKPKEKSSPLVGARVRVPMRSIEREEKSMIPVAIGKKGNEEKTLEGGIPKEQKPTVSEPAEPSIMIEEREIGTKKMFVLGEKEVTKEEKEATVAEVKTKRPEIDRGKEEGKPQLDMVEETKGLAIPEVKPPAGRYTVNIASFRDKDRADRVMKELEEKDFEPFIEKSNIPQKGMWYRVAVGRFLSRGEALAFARALKEKEKMDCFVRELQEAKK